MLSNRPAPAHLMQRLRDGGSADADAVGHAAQTEHQRCATEEPLAEALWEVARAAARSTQPRLQRLRFVTITTDSPGSFAAWVQSLRAALDDAGWRPGRALDVQVLRIANDSVPSIDAAHREVSVEGIEVHVVATGAGHRPLPLAETRPFAFRCVRELGWIPSPEAPVWSLDEDFRFETLVPSRRKMFVRRSGGPLLHRLDALISRLAGDVDVIIGGNSGAAPVPALSVVLGQVRDLVELEPASHAEQLPTALTRLSSQEDAYYDLAEHRDLALRVPLTHGWWREDALIDPFEVTARLRAGLPVTRPALAVPLGNPPTAWAHREDVTVAGGNTVMISPRALDASFTHVKHGELVSRRADTTWCIDARARGAGVVRACLPLLHDRQPRPKSAAEAAREALADALGVGIYRALLTGDVSDDSILGFARARLAGLDACLLEAEASARRARLYEAAFAPFAGWLAEARAQLRGAALELAITERSGFSVRR